jgi:hypothetical protein
MPKDFRFYFPLPTSIYVHRTLELLSLLANLDILDSIGCLKHDSDNNIPQTHAINTLKILARGI